jgi:hypothetical protein
MKHLWPEMWICQFLLQSACNCKTVIQNSKQAAALSPLNYEIMLRYVIPTTMETQHVLIERSFY